MSARSLQTKGVVVARPKSNIYTALLAIALVAILLGILCLYLELRAYNFELKPAGAGMLLPISRRRVWSFFQRLRRR